MQAQNLSPKLLTPTNHVLMLIDHQPQMSFPVANIDVQLMRNNVTGLAKAAQVFQVPTILTEVAEKSFSGPIFPELLAVFPEQTPIDRTTMNAWEDERVVQKVEETGLKRLVIAALWTEVCGALAALSAVHDGYEVYFITDASGGVSKDAHDMSVQRMIQAGVMPMTWLQYLLELQRDWARTETYNAVTEVIQQHAGSYGLGVFYAKAMFNATEAQL